MLVHDNQSTYKPKDRNCVNHSYIAPDITSYSRYTVANSESFFSDNSLVQEKLYRWLILIQIRAFRLNESYLPQRWLDSTKSVKKQVGANAQFWLAVRFYPPEPSRLAEEYTRYLLCLQLRKLLLDGRMNAPKNTALLLASFTVQGLYKNYVLI